MIKSTHKTIQDYFQPAARASKRDTAITPPASRFDTLLRGYLVKPPETDAATRTGLSVQDYFQGRLDGMRSRAAMPLPDQPLSSADSPGETHDAVPGPAPAPVSDPGNPSPSTAVIAPQGKEDAIEKAIRTAAEKYNVPAGLVRSVIRCESNFDAAALSPAGAQGLMQLMPATARDLGVTDPFDIDQNVDGGTRYLAQMLDRFNGDIELALAAYNAGPGTVSRYGGVPPYRETQAYVKKVMALARLPESAPTV